jgi:hypothetical protein
LTESINVIGLSADNNVAKATVLGQARSCLNRQIHRRLGVVVLNSLSAMDGCDRPLLN